MDDSVCPHCHHSMSEHFTEDSHYQCWERDHPYCGGRCGCKYRAQAQVALWDHLLAPDE